MPANNTDVEKRLWDAADELRANSRLRPSEYYLPVLGLIFLRYADHKFAVADEARFGHLVSLLEGENIARAVADAMKAVEDHNPDLKDALPKTYNRLGDSTLVTLLKNFHAIPMDLEGDAFGRIYEHHCYHGTDAPPGRLHTAGRFYKERMHDEIQGQISHRINAIAGLGLRRGQMVFRHAVHQKLHLLLWRRG